MVWYSHLFKNFPQFVVEDKLCVEKEEEGTRDQIASIRWIIEKAREFQKSIYFCFIAAPKPSTVWITRQEY